MNTKRYKIAGMDCESCAAVITFALEDASLTQVKVDGDKKELIVPMELDGQINRIKEIVDTAGHYTLIL